MAFPTDTTRRSLASALDRAQQQAGSIKAIAQNNRDRMAAGTISTSGMLSLLDNLKGAKTVLLAASTLSGMDTFAQAQLGVSVASDFTAMMNAIDAAGGWIITNFPKEAGGALKSEDMDAAGVRTERTFSTAQTAGLRTLLDTLVATIN